MKGVRTARVLPLVLVLAACGAPARPTLFHLLPPESTGVAFAKPVDLEAGNLVIAGEVRHMHLLRRADGERLIVVARNNDELQILRPLRGS